MSVMKKNSWLLKMAFLLAVMMTASDALLIGRRRIQCSTPIGGKETDALMDPRPNLPSIMGFVGAQATIPSLGKCPIDNQFQPPWFLGETTAGGGFCPPEFWNAGALVPGVIIIASAIALYQYITSNLLLVTDSAIGIVPVNAKIDEVTDLELFRDIDSWFMTPLGLVLKLKSDSYKVFPLAWDKKSVEEVLADRL